MDTSVYKSLQAIVHAQQPRHERLRKHLKRLVAKHRLTAHIDIAIEFSTSYQVHSSATPCMVVSEDELRSVNDASRHIHAPTSPGRRLHRVAREPVKAWHRVVAHYVSQQGT